MSYEFPGVIEMVQNLINTDDDQRRIAAVTVENHIRAVAVKTLGELYDHTGDIVAFSINDDEHLMHRKKNGEIAIADNCSGPTDEPPDTLYAKSHGPKAMIHVTQTGPLRMELVHSVRRLSDGQWTQSIQEVAIFTDDL